ISALLAACKMKIYSLTGALRKGSYSPQRHPTRKTCLDHLKQKNFDCGVNMEGIFEQALRIITSHVFRLRRLNC
ncbi:MAG: hypothetical protein OES29_01310, partial [Desulfuromonadales bacterium]|nr:hypothetical protein [Desulfuromonadales bacterium]